MNIIPLQTFKRLGSLLLCSAIFISCDKELAVQTEATAKVEKVKQYDICLSARFEVPALMDRDETGDACVHLYSDRTLKFEINVKNLDPSDKLTVAHLHTGGVLESGPVFLLLVDNDKTVIKNGKAEGEVELSQEQFDKIKDGTDLYFNVHSVQKPGGLLRGQLGINLAFGADVMLSPVNEIPPVTSTGTGKATIRVSKDKVLYSKVEVSNLEAGDALAAGHIHTGGSTVNGPVIVFLAENAGQFGINTSREISTENYNKVLNDAVYVNVHSAMHPAGVMRGQVRD